MQQSLDRWNTPRDRLRYQRQRRERIEAAVEAGGRYVSGPYQAWIAADTFSGGVKVHFTGPDGFGRTVAFALDEKPAINSRTFHELPEAAGEGGGLEG